MLTRSRGGDQGERYGYLVITPLCLPDLEAEIKENERLARLERERAERDAATEELTMAISAAKDSRDAALLVKPIKRARKVPSRRIVALVV